MIGAKKINKNLMVGDRRNIATVASWGSPLETIYGSIFFKIDFSPELLLLKP